MTERLSYCDNMCADSDMGHTQTYIRFRLFMGKRQMGANTEAYLHVGFPAPAGDLIILVFLACVLVLISSSNISEFLPSENTAGHIQSGDRSN